MKNPNPFRGNFYRKIPLFPIFGILIMCFCFILGFALSKGLFRVFGQPTEPYDYVVSGLSGLVFVILFAVIFRFCIVLYDKRNPERSSRKRAIENISVLKDTMDAIERIARGDFTVLIPIDKNDPYKDIAESVNKMMQELSSMETLRQDFISNVSHEIQSPLTSISGFAELLRNEHLEEEQKNHYLDVIEAESRRLSKLSDNLLKLSSLEANETPTHSETFRLDKQIENAVLMMEPQWAEKGIEIEVSLEKMDFAGDKELLAQIWVNLIHNAIKFSPLRGNVSIVLKDDEENIRCSITDNGIGISEADQIHIFERFFKADKSRDRSLGGNGLGLSLVKKITDMHGGEIFIKSTPGKGSSFIVVLPKIFLS